jgi:predicted ATPase
MKTKNLQKPSMLLTTTEGQEAFRQKAYAEAQRYINNAKDALQLAGKDDDYYTDRKYVRTASGVAYSGTLVALDALFTLRGVEMPSKKRRRSIEFYRTNAAKMDGKLLNHLNTVYGALHLEGYYDGILGVDTILSGFKAANKIIELIVPNNPLPLPLPLPPPKPSWARKAYLMFAALFV